MLTMWKKKDGIERRRMEIDTLGVVGAQTGSAALECGWRGTNDLSHWRCAVCK